MWGGATKVPEPKELAGLTGTSFPLNGAPMGTTPLGFLMRWDKRVAVATDYPHQHLSSIPHISHPFSSLLCLSPETHSPLLGVMGPLPNTTIAPIHTAGSNSAILIHLLQTS